MVNKVRSLEIAPEHLSVLQRLSVSGKAEVDKALRAKILLKKAEGKGNIKIAQELNINRHTVELWVNKYRNRKENDSLDDLLTVSEGRGRKAEILGDAKTWIIAEACTSPKELGYAAELWTYDALTAHIRNNAVEAGFPRLATISVNEVFQILEKSKIKPFRIKYYCQRKDPEFDTKMRNLLLLYKQLSMQFDDDGKLIPMEDGQYVHVLSYDEKPGIQALKTIAPDLAPTPDGHGTVGRDYEYRRLGTLSLLAAIDLQVGKAIPLVRQSHSSEDYIDFLKKVDQEYPKDNKIRIVLDNLRVHTSKQTRDYLAQNPGRFEFVFTPKHGSWLNLIESFFSKLTRQMLREIRVETVEELESRLYKYFDEVNASPVVYHWEWALKDVDVHGELNTTTLLEDNI